MSQARQQQRHIQGAIGWALVGLLMTTVLINVIGFISPFWVAWRHPGDLYASHDLLHAWQPIIPWFSVCYALAGWHLAMAMRSVPARACVFAMYLLVPVAMIGAGFAHRVILQANTPIPPQLPAVLYHVANIYLAVAAVAFVALVWWTLRKTNRLFVAEGIAR